MSEVKLTVQQIRDLGLWEKVCEFKDWNPWVLNEGRISEDDIVVFDSTFEKKAENKITFKSKYDNQNCWTIYTLFDNEEKFGEMAIGINNENSFFAYIYKFISYKPHLGYGTKMIEYLKSIGFSTIAGDADPDSIGFWNKFNPSWNEESFEITL